MIPLSQPGVPVVAHTDSSSCGVDLPAASALLLVQIALDDISLDDMWALDLNKLDGWRCVKENTTGDVKEMMDSDDDSNISDNDSAST